MDVKHNRNPQYGYETYETLLRSMQNQMVLAQHNITPRPPQPSSRPKSARPIRHARIQKHSSHRSPPQYPQKRHQTSLLRDSAYCSSIKSNRSPDVHPPCNPNTKLAIKGHSGSSTFDRKRPSSWHSGSSEIAVPQHQTATENMDSQDDLSFDGLTNRDRFLDYPEAYADEEGGVHLPTPAFYISWITNRGRILSPPLTGGPLASRNYSFDPVYFLPMDRSPTNDTPKLPGSDPYGQTDVNHPSQQAINEPGQTYDINFNHPDGHVHCSGEPAYGFDAYDIPEPQIQHESADEELVGLGLYDKPDPKPSPSMLLSSGLSGCAEPFHANQFAFESPPEQVPDAIADEGDDTPVANQYNPWSAAPDYPQPYYGLPQRRHAFDDIDATPTGLHAIDGAHIPAVNETARGYPQMYNGYDVKYPYPEDAFVPYNHFNNYPNQYEQLGYGIPY